MHEIYTAFSFLGFPNRYRDNIWYIDEKFVKVRGSKDDFSYLFVAVDRKNKILATFIAIARTTENAKEILKRAGKKKIPLIIVTDECQI